MATALFAVVTSLERARRRIPGASTLTLLHLLADRRDGIRPSDMAAELGVHQSTITRQLQSLEHAGHVALTTDANDRRSCLVTLTRAGRDEQRRLQKVGLDRFSLFVASWPAEEVRALTRLLTKLEDSKAKVARRERRSRI